MTIVVSITTYIKLCLYFVLTNPVEMNSKLAVITSMSSININLMEKNAGTNQSAFTPKYLGPSMNSTLIDILCISILFKWLINMLLNSFYCLPSFFTKCHPHITLISLSF